MGSTFNPQILVEKLTKLNNSQQSIETLSHWCIFHMNKAKFVVDTWERQFHCSRREQRLAFLYLANDILQNSRRKGAEFVAEFWRVLPEALRDVIKNGDEFGRNAAFRLISIWDERKVFGSRGHILKEEFMGGQPDNNNKNGRPLSSKLRQSVGNILDKIVSDYEAIYDGQLEEDIILNRCSSTVIALEKVLKDISSHMSPGQLSRSGFAEELQGKHSVLRECIEQLTAVESSRESLVLHLKEAVQEQEMKLEKVRGQLQTAQLQADQVINVCRQFVSSDNLPLPDEQGVKEVDNSAAPPGFLSGERQSTPVVYTRQVFQSEKPGTAEDDSRKSVAATMAAKLTASTGSAEMLSNFFTSLATRGMHGGSVNESSDDKQQSEKRPKLENNHFSFAPPPSTPPPPPPPPPPPETQEPPPPLPPFPHPYTLNHVNSTNPQMTPLASSPPPLPPVVPMLPYHMAPQFIPNMSYNYGVTQAQPVPLAGYQSVGAQVTGMSPYPPPAPYQIFQGSEGGFYTQPSSVPMGSVPHQQTL